MFVVPLIERKRDGGVLTPAEWRELIAAYTAGAVPDYQMSALLMAVLWRGLERAELGALTDAMLSSGDRLATCPPSTEGLPPRSRSRRYRHRYRLKPARGRNKNQASDKQQHLRWLPARHILIDA